MSYDECEDWYDNGPGSVKFGRECREQMQRNKEACDLYINCDGSLGMATTSPSVMLEVKDQDSFTLLNDYCLNMALSKVDLTDGLRNLIRDRYLQTALDYELAWKKWSPGESEIESIEDELFKV